MQVEPPSRIELPVMLRASPMDRGGLHTWLATRKAEADKKREEEVRFIFIVFDIITINISGGNCQQPVAGKELSDSSARKKEIGKDKSGLKQAVTPCLRGDGLGKGRKHEGEAEEGPVEGLVRGREGRDGSASAIGCC